MKIKNAHTLLAAVILALATAVCWGHTALAQSADSVLGTWELVSHDYAGQQAPAGQRQVKILAPGHFTWVTYDTTKMKTVGVGVGTWALSGNAYSEHVDFLDQEGAPNMNGTDLKFTVNVSGDTLTQSGSIGETKMKETWKRLK
jgi:hypothetical protein